MHVAESQTNSFGAIIAYWYSRLYCPRDRNSKRVGRIARLHCPGRDGRAAGVAGVPGQFGSVESRVERLLRGRWVPHARLDLGWRVHAADSELDADVRGTRGVFVWPLKRAR